MIPFHTKDTPPVSRKHIEPTVQFKGRLPASLVREVKILLLDPTTGQVRYGSLSDLLTKLLRDWVNEMRLQSGETHG